MIRSFLATTGFAADLPCFKNTKLEFKPGINVIFGPNGCGKTTLLSMLAAYCGIKKGGWTSFPGWTDVNRSKDDKAVYPHALARNCPNECEAEVEWDGTPTYWHSASSGDAVMTVSSLVDTDDSPDGVTSTLEQVAHLMHKPSAGQYRQLKIKQMFDLLKNRPKFTQKMVDDAYKHVKPVHQGFLDYMNRGDQKGPATVLLDEMDRSLSIDLQVAFWENILPRWGKGLQIIIATHSPVCLLRKAEGISWIDMQAGYLETSRKWLNGLIAGEDLFPEQKK